MRGTFAFLLSTILMVASCDDDSDPHRDTLEYFQLYLHQDMKFDKLKHTFGDPDRDIGSGIHIYIYDLSDGTKIQIGYTDKILYARQLDKDDQLLLALIE